MFRLPTTGIPFKETLSAKEYVSSISNDTPLKHIWIKLKNTINGQVYLKFGNYTIEIYSSILTLIFILLVTHLKKSTLDKYNFMVLLNMIKII